jgi:hypothetical protein
MTLNMIVFGKIMWKLPPCTLNSKSQKSNQSNSVFLFFPLALIFVCLSFSFWSNFIWNSCHWISIATNMYTSFRFHTTYQKNSIHKIWHSGNFIPNKHFEFASKLWASRKCTTKGFLFFYVGRVSVLSVHRFRWRLFSAVSSNTWRMISSNPLKSRFIISTTRKYEKFMFPQTLQKRLY